ncbi:hypothetical protein N9153_02070 [Planctomicrobium sp.]|nr:hypothetical protein [Planctomicrobium sp.]MDB4731671.1 hypothetical protein [bacterium]
MISTSQASCKIWVDGVGCYLVCFGDDVQIGNARPDVQKGSHIAIVSDLASQQAAINFRDESYWMQSIQQTSIDGVKVSGVTNLCHGQLLTMGEDVQLRFLIPSSLSQSAVLQLESPHRFANGVDGVILFRKTCLLGDGTQKHITCRDWSADVVLFTRGDYLFCKTMQGEISVDGETFGREIQVMSKKHLQGNDWSMSIETEEIN